MEVAGNHAKDPAVVKDPAVQRGSAVEKGPAAALGNGYRGGLPGVASSMR